MTVDWQIPLADIGFGPEETEAVVKVLEGRWLTMGAVTQAFEQEVAAYVGVRHALAVANGTAALHLACLAAGLGMGDEVIVPALTFVATANAIRYVGATPVFADIESEQNLCLSLPAIQSSLTEKTKAIMVMHYGGYACDMPAICSFAKEHGLVVIEDAAHAIGSELHGRKLGTWGEIGCFSFFSNKNLTTGEGGMLITNDDSIAEQLRTMRSHGMTAMTWDRHKGHAWSYDVVTLGYNYRIDEIRSAIGRVQLRKLEKNNATRRFLIAMYRKHLGELVPQVSVPFKDFRGISAAHLFPILLPQGVNRFRFMEQMKSRGIQTSIHYPPIHHFQAYEQWRSASLPMTESVAAREVTLPLFPAMSEEDVRKVVLSVSKSLPA